MTLENKSEARRRRSTKGTTNLKGDRLLESGLTVEQEAYCRCRASGMSIEESIFTSGIGITHRTALRWEQPNGERSSAKIRARINELSQIAQKNAILKTGLTREWVISRLMQVAERCMQAEPVLRKVNGELIETGEYVFDSSGANTALRALGDTVGMFNKKNFDDGNDDEFSDLSDDQLIELAREYGNKCGILENNKTATPEPGLSNDQLLELVRKYEARFGLLETAQSDSSAKREKEVTVLPAIPKAS